MLMDVLSKMLPAADGAAEPGAAALPEGVNPDPIARHFERLERRRLLRETAEA